VCVYLSFYQNIAFQAAVQSDISVIYYVFIAKKREKAYGIVFIILIYMNSFFKI